MKLRPIFLALALASWAMWIAIAAGRHGEHDGDSAAFLTCFTFWAPASYLLVLGRRSWERPTAAHVLLLVSAAVAAALELMTIARSSGSFSRFLHPTFESLPPAVGIALFYGAYASLFLTPLLSICVFVLGGRRNT